MRKFWSMILALSILCTSLISITAQRQKLLILTTEAYKAIMFYNFNVQENYGG